MGPERKVRECQGKCGAQTGLGKGPRIAVPETVDAGVNPSIFNSRMPRATAMFENPTAPHLNLKPRNVEYQTVGWVQVHSQVFVMSQACGCIAELCVGDAAQREIIKEVLSRAGGVKAAILAFRAGHDIHDSNLMLLSSTALCNIMADRASDKADAVKEGAIETFSRVLLDLDSSTPSRLQTASASTLFNLASSHVSIKYSEPVKAAMRKIHVSSKIDERLLWSSPSHSQASGAIDPSQSALRRTWSPQRQSHVVVNGLQAPTKLPYHDQGPPPSVAAPGPRASQSVHEANGAYNNVTHRGVEKSPDSSLGPSQAPKMRNFVNKSFAT